MKINQFTAPLRDLLTVFVFDDFTADQSDINYVDTVTDTGTVLAGDDVNGVVTLLASDVTVADNDEAYIATPNEIFKFGVDSPFYGRCRLKFTETAAGILSVAFGFQNAVGADSIVDNTGLPKVTGSTVAIYKTDGSSVWKCVSSCNGTATHSTSTAAAVGATWYVLEIHVMDFDNVTMEVAFMVDGEYLRDSNNIPISHRVAIASATEMQMFAGVKLGAITNNDPLLVDYWYGATNRV